jgi:hypothetical protein
MAADSKNCFGCGTSCGGSTPICDKILKACGCDAASCQPLGKICDSALHQCIFDPARPDVYVDSTAGRNEEGTKEHPYRTITAALLAPRSPGVFLHVHVAAGRYDKDHGEILPLVVRGASIEGAGIQDTFIAGTGVYDARVAQGAINAEVSAAIVIGDAGGTSGVSNLTIYDPVVSPPAVHYGVFCDRGNAPASGTSVAANTILNQLSVGPGLDIGVVATTSTVPMALGCNLQVTASEFKVNDAGLWAAGCDIPSGTSTSRVPVVLRLGDGQQKGGNKFAGFPLEVGTGVRVAGCVRTIASYNSFTHGQVGVAILQPAHMNEINQHVWQHNTFDSLFRFGMTAAGGAAFISELSNNTFNSIAPPEQDVPVQAAGLLVEGVQGDTGFAHINNATNNQFSHDQNGIVFQSNFPIGGSVDRSFFNGGNIFHCNAAEIYSSPHNIFGGDVVFTIPSGTFEFNDNEWDHAPPNKAATLTVDGTDLVAPAGVTVSTANATAVDVGCLHP